MLVVHELLGRKGTDLENIVKAIVTQTSKRYSLETSEPYEFKDIGKFVCWYLEDHPEYIALVEPKDFKVKSGGLGVRLLSDATFMYLLESGKTKFAIFNDEIFNEKEIFSLYGKRTRSKCLNDELKRLGGSLGNIKQSANDMHILTPIYSELIYQVQHYPEVLAHLGIDSPMNQEQSKIINESSQYSPIDRPNSNIMGMGGSLDTNWKNEAALGYDIINIRYSQGRIAVSMDDANFDYQDRIIADFTQCIEVAKNLLPPEWREHVQYKIEASNNSLFFTPTGNPKSADVTTSFLFAYFDKIQTLNSKP